MLKPCVDWDSGCINVNFYLILTDRLKPIHVPPRMFNGPRVKKPVVHQLQQKIIFKMHFTSKTLRENARSTAQSLYILSSFIEQSVSATHRNCDLLVDFLFICMGYLNVEIYFVRSYIYLLNWK